MSILKWILNQDIEVAMKTIKVKKQYEKIYEEIAEKTNLPLSFIIAHAEIESNQNHTATGKLGEYGLWQFLPSTWKKLMGNADWKNVENQKIAYIKHAKWIIEKYNLNPQDKNDLKKFLWIWNAGSVNYERGYLPDTTKTYIQKIIEYV
jgi:hypothetical protein